MTRLTLRAWLLSAAVVASGASAAAQVSGKLLLGSLKPLSAPPVQGRAASCNWEIENGFKEVQPDHADARRELAVVLVSESVAPKPTDASRLEVAFSGGSLMPSTIVARVGTTLLIRNDDEISHELYAVELPGFSAEPTSARGRRSIALKTAGHWPLRDRSLPHVNGHLHVLPDLVAVGTLEASGQFSFGDLQPGVYTLKVFQGERELLTRPVELGARPITLDALALGAGAPSK
jgi:hypothetical protein